LTHGAPAESAAANIRERYASLSPQILQIPSDLNGRDGLLFAEMSELPRADVP
jgi:hypothetical protein